MYVCCPVLLPFFLNPLLDLRFPFHFYVLWLWSSSYDWKWILVNQKCFWGGELNQLGLEDIIKIVHDIMWLSNHTQTTEYKAHKVRMLEGWRCTAKTRRFPQKGFVSTRNWPAFSFSSTRADQNSWKGKRDRKTGWWESRRRGSLFTLETNDFIRR